MPVASHLTVEHLFKYFAVKRGFLKGTVGNVRAVDDVSFSIQTGECFGVVGESGCGKTTLARCLIGLVKADKGQIIFHGTSRHGGNQDIDVLRAPHEQVLELRRQVQIVFQDPFSSLDPRMPIFDIVAEPLHAQRVPRAQIAQRVPEVLIQVGLGPAYGGRYPHELSGGQRQRVGVARALAVQPSLVLLDEPVSALDVSVRAQVLNLLLRLQKEMGLTYLFITHDLSVVKHLSDRIAVMYLGQIVELGETRHVFERPAHPYTEALLASAPIVDTQGRHLRSIIKGDVPSAVNLPPACRFSTRCLYAQEVCRRDVPETRTLDDGRLVSCHFTEKLSLAGVRDARQGVAPQR